MLTYVEKSMRKESDALFRKLEAYRTMRDRKEGMLEVIKSDNGIVDKLEYDIKLLNMYILALTEMTSKMIDIEHVIGS